MARVGRDIADSLQASGVEGFDTLVDAAGILARAAALEDEPGLRSALVVEFQVGRHIGATAEQTVVAEDGGTAQGDGLGLHAAHRQTGHGATLAAGGGVEV